MPTVPASPPMPGRPLGGPAAWRGEELRRSRGWVRALALREIDELRAAAEGIAGRSLAEVHRADVPLPNAADALGELRSELLHGRGFALLRGLPATRSREAAALFWTLGLHLGRPVSQNAQGHLLGHVRDLGRDVADPSARIYQTSERQGWHTDSADLVALCCLRPAREGGRSGLVSAVTLHDALLERCPELLAELFGAFRTDHRGEQPDGAPPFFTAPVLSWHGGELSVLYQRRYIESAQRFAGVPPLTERQVAALDALDAAADDPALHLELDLAPGDVLLIHNHALLHDRTAFVDGPEPERRRHLLRLWLCPPEGRALPPCFAERYGSVTVGQRGGVPPAPGVTPTAPLP